MVFQSPPGGFAEKCERSNELKFGWAESLTEILGNNFGNISQREYVEYGALTAVFNGKNAIFALLRRLITQRSQVQILTPLPIDLRKLRQLQGE